MNEDTANTPISHSPLSRGVTVLHSLPIRIIFATAIWFAAQLQSSIQHMCGRGYKTAEHLAPFVIASLAALSVLLIRRYRIGIPLAVAIVALYVSVVWPAYSTWIHGPNAPDFPNASSATRVLEDLKIIEAQETESKAKLPNENTPGK